MDLSLGGRFGAHSPRSGPTRSEEGPAALARPAAGRTRSSIVARLQSALFALLAVALFAALVTGLVAGGGTAGSGDGVAAGASDGVTADTGAVAGAGAITADAAAGTTADTAAGTTANTAVDTAADTTGSAGNATAFRANVTVEQQTVLVGEPVRLDLSGSTGNSQVSELDAGSENASVNELTGTVVYESAGNYTLEVTLVGPDGERDTDTANVTVEPFDLAIDLAVSDADPVVGQPVEFEVVGETGTVVRYNWSVDDDDGLDRYSQRKRQTYHDAGTHTVAVTAHTFDGQADTATANVSVSPQNESATIDAAFEVVDTGPAAEAPVELDASASDGTIEQYYWTFGDGTESLQSDPHVTHDYLRDGTYNVTLEAIGEDATDATTDEVVAGPRGPPNVSITAEHVNATLANTYEFGVNVTRGSVDQYHWRMGDGTTYDRQYAARVRHSYDKPGTYPVELTAVARNGEAAHVQTNLTVDPYELSTVFSRPRSHPPVVGEPLRLGVGFGYYSNTSAEWELGDGTSKTTTGSTKVQHTYDQPGTYTVEERVFSDGALIATLTKNVTVVEQHDTDQIEAVLDLPEEPVSVGSAVDLDFRSSTGPIDNYWLEGEGEQGYSWIYRTTRHYEVFNEPGTYSVSLLVAGANETDVTTANVTVVDPSSAADESDTDTISVAPRPPSPGSDAPAFEIVGIDAPSSVEPSETFDVTVDVENTGDAAGTADVEVDVESGADASAARDLDAGVNGQVDVSLAAPESTGRYQLTVTTEDDETTQSVVVEDGSADDFEDESDDDADGDGARDDEDVSDDGGSGDGTPGFGVVTALVALAVGLVALRRSEL